MTLTPREKQIAALIRRGKQNKEIAYDLGLTIGTVKEYIFHLFKKLGCHNRTEVAILTKDL